MTQSRSRAAMIESALNGSIADTQELHEQCADPQVAEDVSKLLLTTLPNHASTVEIWLQAIVEIHPHLAAPIGRELALRIQPDVKQPTPDKLVPVLAIRAVTAP